MKIDTRSATAWLLGALIAAAGCDSSSAECPGGCPVGQTCFYGACVPDQDATDGGVDVAPDAEADAAVETDGDGRIDADADGETVTAVDAETTIDADADAPAEAETDSEDVTYEDGCGPERCNALDDDCDGRTDEDFACVAGTTLSCTTWCGSAGTMVCSDTCLLPGTCTPPDEICDNRLDDNCDGTIDEGCGPAHDTCAAPLDVSAGGTFTGSTVAMADDAGAPRTCVSTDPPTPAPDAFFFFDLT